MKDKLYPIMLIFTAILLVACSSINRFFSSNQPDQSPEILFETDDPPGFESEETIEPQTTSTDIPTDKPFIEEELSICDHPFLPVIDGAVWTFSEGFNGSYTLTLEKTGDDTFTMVQEMHDDESTFSVDWYCQEDGLLQGTFPQADLFNSPGVDGAGDIIFRTTFWEGQTLPDPENIVIGYSWTAQYTLTGESNMDGLTSTQTINVKIDYIIAAIEPVTVPAGTFPEAYRVDSTSAMEMTIGDSTSPMTVLTQQFSTWYVEGIGLIKTNSEFFGTDVSVELLDSSLIQ